MNQTLNAQAAILSYTDVFGVCALPAFAVVPVVLPFPQLEGRVRRGAGAWTVTYGTCALANKT